MSFVVRVNWKFLPSVQHEPPERIVFCAFER